MGHVLHPIDLAKWRKFLKFTGCQFKRTTGDHEIWSRSGLKRPVVFQVKDKEIHPGHIRTNLRTLGMSIDDFLSFIDHC